MTGRACNHGTSWHANGNHGPLVAYHGRCHGSPMEYTPAPWRAHETFTVDGWCVVVGRNIIAPEVKY